MDNIIFSPLAIRKRCKDYADRPYPTEITKTRRGAIIGSISKALKVNDKESNTEIDQKRYLVFGFLFTPPLKPLEPLASKDLTPQQFNALFQWIGFEENNGIWSQRASFSDECKWIYTRACWILDAQQQGKDKSFVMASFDFFDTVDQYDVERSGILSKEKA